MMPPHVTGLERTMSEYLTQNAYITPSGMWSQAQLDYCVATVGTDRIMFSVDYPFFPCDGATAFLDAANLTPEQRLDIEHRTADRLLGLKVAGGR
jgi:predicted TIM-barrel fold metal-dependent hydrolase